MISQEEKEALVGLRDSSAWPALLKLNSILVENFAHQLRTCPEDKLLATRKRFEGAIEMAAAVEKNIAQLTREDKQEQRPSLKRTK